MNITDVAYMSAVMIALAGLRFGVPILMTWLIGKAAGRLTHVSS